MATPIWLVSLIKKSFGKIFILARLTKAPFIGRMVEWALFENDDIIYLPKDGVIPVGQEIEGRRDVVLPSMVAEHFVNQASHLWIMDTCICRESQDCKDYPIERGCLFLGQATQRINPRLGRPVSRDEALEHLAECRRQGLVHLIGRNKLDAVWLGTGQGSRLMTICNCCPCCCLWRVLPVINDRIASNISGLPGISLSVTEDCVGCGKCQDGVCFVEAITMQNGKASIGSDCRTCGRCAEVCPTGAIEVLIEDQATLDRAISRLAAAVNVS